MFATRTVACHGDSDDDFLDGDGPETELRPEIELRMDYAATVGSTKDYEEPVAGEEARVDRGKRSSLSLQRRVGLDDNENALDNDALRMLQKLGNKAKLVRLLLAKDIQILHGPQEEIKLDRIIKWAGPGSEGLFRPPSDYAKLTNALQSVLEWIVKHLRTHREALSYVAKTIKPWEDVVVQTEKDKRMPTDVSTEEYAAVDPLMFGPMSLSWMTSTKGTIDEHEQRLNVLEETSQIIRNRIDKIAYDALERILRPDPKLEEDKDLLCRRDSSEKYCVPDAWQRKLSVQSRDSLQSQEPTSPKSPRARLRESNSRPTSPPEPPALQVPRGSAGETIQADDRPASARSRFRAAGLAAGLGSSILAHRRLGQCVANEPASSSRRPSLRQSQHRHAVGDTLNMLSSQSSQKPANPEGGIKSPPDEEQQRPVPMIDVAMQYVTRPEMMEMQEASNTFKESISKKWEDLQTQVQSTVRRIDDVERLTSQRFTEIKEHAREAAVAIASCNKKLFADEEKGKETSGEELPRSSSRRGILSKREESPVASVSVASVASVSVPAGDSAHEESLQMLNERITAIEKLVQCVPADIARLEQAISGHQLRSQSSNGGAFNACAESVRAEARDVAREHAERIAGRAEAAVAALEQRLLRMCGNNANKGWSAHSDSARRIRPPSSQAEAERSASPSSMGSPHCSTPGIWKPDHRKALVSSTQGCPLKIETPNDGRKYRFKGANPELDEDAQNYGLAMIKGRKKKVLSKAAPILMPMSVTGKVDPNAHVTIGNADILESGGENQPRASLQQLGEDSPRDTSAEHSQEDTPQPDADLPMSPIQSVRVSVNRTSTAAEEKSPRKNFSRRGTVAHVKISSR